MNIAVNAALPGLALLSACQGDHLTQSRPIDPAILYWTLELNHRAVTLSTTAPYDTLTLVATPRNQAKEALSGLRTPEYRSTDPERVQITTGGVLVAVQPTSSPVAVIATLTADNLKHIDTVFVRVVQVTSPPVLGTFSIHPVAPDSAKHAADNGIGFSLFYLLNRLVHASDTTGVALDTASVDFEPVGAVSLPSPVPVTDLMVAFRSADTTIASIADVSVSGTHIYKLLGRQPGTVMLYASTTAFGVSKADSTPFRIGLPVFSNIYIFRNASAGDRYTARIAAGGVVQWGTDSGVGVTFSDPTNVMPASAAAPYLSMPVACFILFSYPCTDGGNIAPQPFQIYQVRTFPVPGTYDFIVTGPDWSKSGRVVVVEDP